MIFSDLSSLPEIKEVSNLQEYWDAVLSRLSILRLPRLRAMAALLRAFDVGEAIGRAFRGPGAAIWPPDAIDAMFYLVNLIHAKSPRVLVGTLESTAPSALADLSLAQMTIPHMGRLARIRDLIESVRVGMAECTIDQPTKTIEFSSGPITHIDLLRREDNLRRYSARKAERDRRLLILASERPEFRLATDRVRALLTAPLKSADISRRVIDLASSIHAVSSIVRSHEESPFFAPMLSRSLDLGAYSVGDYEAVVHFLNALGTAFRLIRNSVEPMLDSLLLYETESLAKDAASACMIAEARCAEVIRDLTFTADVPWLDVLDHPLIPWAEGCVVTISGLLAPEAWVRRLLRGLERLPWRARERRAFNDAREQLMQSYIESKLDGLGLHFVRNIKIGPRAKRIGDLDLLVWSDDATRALAVSLKWFYHPIYVQETWAQIDRLESAILQHGRLMAAWSEFGEEVSRARGIPLNVDMTSVVVIEPGPVRESVRRLGIIVVSLEEFIECLSAGGADLSASAAQLTKNMKDVPLIDVKYVRQSAQYGPYNFVMSNPSM
jgi:hypothetical protein